MKERAAKGFFAGVCAITAYLSDTFTPVIHVMALFEALDYLTGMAAAIKSKSGISSEEAFWGFVKKLCYFIMVGVAFAFDYVIVQTTTRLGIALPWPGLLGLMSLCYLTSTEGISILENLQELGVSAPFLKTALKTYRQAVTKKAGKTDGEA